MEKLLELLYDSNTRTVEELAMMLHTSVEDVKRQIEYLENTGIIKNISLLSHDNGCGSCQGCQSGEGSCAACKGCIPPDAGVNMGKVWEVSG